MSGEVRGNKSVKVLGVTVKVVKGKGKKSRDE